ncbi:hypothetical protein YDYSG_22700 [Paenibacillus tyrfis]|nr:hypothetical protein YDYSG_22700 [Paenibacillus tyrfis]
MYTGMTTLISRNGITSFRQLAAGPAPLLRIIAARPHGRLGFWRAIGFWMRPEKTATKPD